MSELVLKIPKGKPPFIGVMYNYVSYVPTDNHDLIVEKKYKGAEYKLVLEFIRNFVNIKLICEEHIVIREYLHHKYDADLMQRWLRLVNGKGPFNFGHVTKVNDRDEIMRTVQARQPVFFKVTELVVLSADQGISPEGLPY